MHYAIINLRLGTNIKSEWWLGKPERKTRRKKTVSLCTCALFLASQRRGRWARASSQAAHQCQCSAATSVSARPTAHSKQNTIVKIHRINHIILAAGATRDKLDRADKAVLCNYGGEGETSNLSLGTWMGLKVSCFSRKPVEIRWVTAGQSSRSAAASEADGEPDECGSPSATDSRRRLMIQFRCINTKRN